MLIDSGLLLFLCTFFFKSIWISFQRIDYKQCNIYAWHGVAQQKKKDQMKCLQQQQQI